MSLARASLIVGLCTVASRLLGFARDVLIARLLGAGPVADAFLLAFRLPNLARRVFAEGGLNAGFVPLHARIAREDGPEAARRFAGESIAGSAVVALGLVAVVELLAPALVVVLAAGYEAEADKMELATFYLRLAFPFVAFVALAALVSAVLNAERHFVAAAVAPVLVNVVLIAALLGLPGGVGGEPERTGAWLALAVTLSGMVHLVVVVAALARMPGRPRLIWPRLSPNLRRLVRLSLPALAASGVAQLAILAATLVASHQPGAVSWLYYADRVFQLPLSLVGVAVGLVLLPEIAVRLAHGDEGGAVVAQNRALEAALALALPAAVALVVLAEPIAAVLFERGAFGPDDTAGTAAALAALAPALPAAVVGKILAQPFFARETVRLPVLAGFAGVALTGLGGLLLARPFGVAGIALATSLGLTVHALILAVGGWSSHRWRGDARLRRNVPRLLLASLGMGLAVYGALRLAGPLLAGDQGFAVRTAVLFALCATGLAVYGLSAHLLGALVWRDLKGLVRAG